MMPQILLIVLFQNLLELLPSFLIIDHHGVPCVVDSTRFHEFEFCINIFGSVDLELSAFLLLNLISVANEVCLQYLQSHPPEYAFIHGLSLLSIFFKNCFPLF